MFLNSHRIRAKKREEQKRSEELKPNLVKSIAETNELPKVPFTPQEIDEFGRAKTLEQSFFEDKPTPEPKNLTCIQIQHKLRDYEELTFQQQNSISNCDSCSLVYASYRNV